MKFEVDSPVPTARELKAVLCEDATSSVLYIKTGLKRVVAIYNFNDGASASVAELSGELEQYADFGEQTFFYEGDGLTLRF